MAKFYVNERRATNQTGRKRKAWRALIVSAMERFIVDVPFNAHNIAKAIANEMGELMPDSGGGSFYTALRSLVDDGTLERHEGANDGFRRNVWYALKDPTTVQMTAPGGD